MCFQTGLIFAFVCFRSQACSSTTPQRMSWQSRAAQKKQEVFDCIPSEWLLPKSHPAFLNRRYDYANELYHLIFFSRSVIDVPNSCGILSPMEIEITNYTSAPELVQKMQKKVYTAVEVVTAFCKRAAIAHQLVFSLYYLFFFLIK